jgi:hypothetical protein
MRQLDEGEKVDMDDAFASVADLPIMMQADGAIKFRIKLTQFARKPLGTNGPNSGLPERKLSGWKGKARGWLDDINLLYENKSLMDLKIQTKNGKIFEAHKAVLAGEFSDFELIKLERKTKVISRVFLWFGYFKIVRSQEFQRMIGEGGIDSVLNLNDVSSEVLAILLPYIYKGSFDKVKEVVKENIFREIVYAANKVQKTHKTHDIYSFIRYEFYKLSHVLFSTNFFRWKTTAITFCRRLAQRRTVWLFIILQSNTNYRKQHQKSNALWNREFLI